MHHTLALQRSNMIGILEISELSQRGPKALTKDGMSVACHGNYRENEKLPNGQDGKEALLH
jgi:hypothetical protein